jgi:hypothetical protein
MENGARDSAALLFPPATGRIALAAAQEVGVTAPRSLRCDRCNGGPHSMRKRFFSAAHAVHVGAAAVLIIGAALHIGGVIKHVTFNRDGTFAKMLAADNPARRQQSDHSAIPKTHS